MLYSIIKDNDIANGDGITMSLWTQGCPHRCKGCHNPQTWSFDNGKEFTDKELQYILDNINKNNVNRNLSLLGGEPLCPPNVEGILNLCKKFKEKYPNKIIYLWTGYTVEEFDDIQKEVLKYIDILIDGRFILELRDLRLKFKGSSNQRVIDVKESLKQNKIVVIG